MKILKQTVLAAVSTLVLVLNAGCAPQMTIWGTITVDADYRSMYSQDLGGVSLGKPCINDSGYGDVSAGSQVVVLNQNSDIIGSGSLIPTGAINANIKVACTYSFSVEVPGGQGFYSLKIGNRGALVYQESELNAPITLTLGG